MAVNSAILDPGTKAPDFTLPDTDGNMVSLNHFNGAPAYLILFICNHCPYVKHISSELVKIYNDYSPKGLAMIAISSNDTDAYPDDSYENMKTEKETMEYQFPYLYDESQGAAKAYKAACTPDMYLFDKNKNLVYHGQLDDSRPNYETLRDAFYRQYPDRKYHEKPREKMPGTEIPVTGKDLRAALDAVINGTGLPADQKLSIGCNIKWKPGNAPEYFG